MTKERLRRYGAIKREHRQLEEQLEQIETQLYSPKAQRLTGMPSAPHDGNAMEELAAKHIELQEHYRRLIAELSEEMLAVEAAIEGLDPTSRTLMRYRYIDGLKWEEICVAMNYSWPNVHKMHKRILDRLRDEEQDNI